MVDTPSLSQSRIQNCSMGRRLRRKAAEGYADGGSSSQDEGLHGCLRLDQDGHTKFAHEIEEPQ